MKFYRNVYEDRVNHAIEVVKQVMFVAGVNDMWREDLIAELEDIRDRAIANLDDWDQFYNPEDYDNE